MASFWMNLSKRVLQRNGGYQLPSDPSGIFVLQGAVELAGNTVGEGDGCFAADGSLRSEAGAEFLHFHVSQQAADANVLSESFEFHEADGVFRLDQVCFPPGARAYRHTHPGPGIRCLTRGALEIQSDHHTERLTQTAAWFEGAESPVQATATDTPTAFVRAMILPMAFLGKPTLNILDPVDAAKPRLQTNRRFFDQVLRLRAN